MAEHVIHEGSFFTLIAGAIIALVVVVAWGSRRLRLPSPLAFLLVGVAAQSFTDYTFDVTEQETLVTLGTVALAVVLFEGGFHGGWSRTRAVLGPVLGLGLVGTFACAALMAAAGHYLLGLSWATASLVAIALAPTDPAAVFSVLAGQELKGRAGQVLEGESGVNDPVGIALMIGAVELVGHGGSLSEEFWGIAASFGTELVVGLLVGIALGFGGNWVLTHLPLPSPAVHATAAIGVAFIAVGITPELHGSGFLAAFVAGLIIGEEDVQHHEHTEDVLSVGANLGEIAMFLALGLTISFDKFDDSVAIELGLFALLTFLVRPLVTHAVLAPSSLARREQAFIAWGGLRGAVPIILAFFAVIEGVDDADRIYTVVFVTVTLSILVQGSTLPWLARKLDLVQETR